MLMEIGIDGIHLGVAIALVSLPGWKAFWPPEPFLAFTPHLTGDGILIHAAIVCYDPIRRRRNGHNDETEQCSRTHSSHERTIP